MDFQLTSKYKPTGDQPDAIRQLTDGIQDGVPAQVLLGVTGSGKTFTVANVIANVGKPTLILSHNKTLAAQLYQEMKGFFPNNAVEYYVSYYDYYQPEAYLPTTDTYIEKDLAINDDIDKLRLSAVSALLSGRKDVIVVSSVSCIYGMGEAFGTQPKDVLVGIGPAIGPCCYEVGAEVAEKFRAAFPYADECLLKEQDGHIHLNLWEANRQQMLRAGVPEENIEVAGECTCCRHKWYYSYRADGGKTGRIAAMIALKPEA